MTLVDEAPAPTAGAGWSRIVKAPKRLRVPPHLDDYPRVRACFSWEAIGRRLSRPPWDDGLNIAHEAVDRHAAGERRDRVALR